MFAQGGDDRLIDSYVSLSTSEVADYMHIETMNVNRLNSQMMSPSDHCGGCAYV